MLSELEDLPNKELFKFEHYPFAMGSGEKVNDKLIVGQAERFAKLPVFSGVRVSEIVDHILYKYDGNKKLFTPEMQKRFPYHYAHAAFQMPYDDMQLQIDTFTHNPKLAETLTPEGVLAQVDSAIIHDSGLALAVHNGSPLIYPVVNRLHVPLGMEWAEHTLLEGKAPKFLQAKSARQFVIISAKLNILQTYHPFGESQQQEFDQLMALLGATEQQEAMHHAKVTQAGDFGQCCTADNATVGTELLTFEFNQEDGVFGTNILGTKETKLAKLKGFVMGVVKPAIGPTLYRIYQTDNNAFNKELINQGPIRRVIGDYHACQLSSPTEIIL